MNRLPARFAGRALATVALAGLAAGPILAQGNPVGITAALRNDVRIRPAGADKGRKAVLRERVILNDEVRTGDASQLQILLLDRTTFTVGANARVAIDRFVYDPAARSRALGVSVTRGAFRFMSGRALTRPSGTATVRTPVASIGIRGTIFELVVGEDAVRIAKDEPGLGKPGKSDKDEASLILLRGPGPATQGDTVAGAIDVTAGGRIVAVEGPELAVYVPRAGAAPIGPFRISPAGLSAIQALLRPEPPKAGGGGSHTGRNLAIGAAAVGAAVVGATLLGGKKKPKPPKSQRNPNGRSY